MWKVGMEKVGRPGDGQMGSKQGFARMIHFLDDSFLESCAWCPEDFTTQENGKVTFKIDRTFILWETRNHQYLLGQIGF